MQTVWTGKFVAAEVADCEEDVCSVSEELQAHWRLEIASPRGTHRTKERAGGSSRRSAGNDGLFREY